MKAFRITLAALAAVAVAAPAAVASPLPVEGGSSDWATPRALVTGSAASHYTTASVAALGARGEAAAAFYQSKTKANAAATGVVSRPRPSGAADTPGTSGAALADLYGYDDAVPTAAQLSDDAADAARSVGRRNTEQVIDAFDGYYDMWPTGTDRSPGSQPAAQHADDLDAALAAYEEGGIDPWLRRVLGLPDADQSTKTARCFTAVLEPTPSSRAADPQSEAYAAAMEAYRSGAIDPMLREILGISGFGRHVLLVHRDVPCSTRSAFGPPDATAGDWRGQTDVSSGYSPGVAADSLASLYSVEIEPVA